eukprot:gene5855-9683_t
MSSLVELPNNTDFEVSFGSDIPLETLILEFNSNHQLINFFENSDVKENLFTSEPMEKKKEKFIFRRHFILKNLPLQPYHYFIFILPPHQETYCELFVNESIFSFNCSKTNYKICGFMYKTEEKCQFQLILDLKFQLPSTPLEIEKFSSKVLELMEIDVTPKMLQKFDFKKNMNQRLMSQSCEKLEFNFSWNIVGVQFKIQIFVVAFDKFGNSIEEISERNKQGVRDENRIFAISMEDNQNVLIRCNSIPKNVQGIIVKTEIYPKDKTYLRVTDSILKVNAHKNHSKKHILNMRLSQSFQHSMIWAKLTREGNDWDFLCIDEPMNKNMKLSSFVAFDEYKKLDEEIEKLESEKLERTKKFLDEEEKFSKLTEKISRMVKENDKKIKLLDKENTGIRNQMDENLNKFREYKEVIGNLIDNRLDSNGRSKSILEIFDSDLEQYKKKSADLHPKTSFELKRLPNEERDEFIELKRELFGTKVPNPREEHVTNSFDT